MSKSVIKIEHLYFRYEKETILEDISLEVAPKDFLAIVGPNGGGKSTLLKLVLGILKPESGSIKLFGTSSEIYLTRIGYVPQETGYNMDFPISVLDVVLMGLLHRRTLFRRFTKEHKRMALKALQKVGMEDFSKRHIAELSGGQRQRVLIARALCGDPEILILDEPTASIDFNGQKEIFELLEQLNDQMTIIVVSHDMSMVMGFAKHVAYINRSIVMHTMDLHARYQLRKQLAGHTGHYCGAEFLQELGDKIECNGECGQKREKIS